MADYYDEADCSTRDYIHLRNEVDVLEIDHEGHRVRLAIKLILKSNAQTYHISDPAYPYHVKVNGNIFDDGTTKYDFRQYSEKVLVDDTKWVNLSANDTAPVDIEGYINGAHCGMAETSIGFIITFEGNGKMYVKTSSGVKKGQVYVKTSNGVKKAKAVWVKTSNGLKKAE